MYNVTSKTAKDLTVRDSRKSWKYRSRVFSFAVFSVVFTVAEFCQVFALFGGFLGVSAQFKMQAYSHFAIYGF